MALLADVSASTDAGSPANRRIVDVEKDALFIVCEALDALGDRMRSSRSPAKAQEHVSVVPLKRFEERSSVSLRRRIAALDSDRYTRVGAAIRHPTAPLCREQTDRRLLLVLSDGKPNDVDMYEGRYGSRILARPLPKRAPERDVFCLTVDRDAPRYAPRIFGRAGFAVLRRPDQLPEVLIEVLRRLIRPA